LFIAQQCINAAQKDPSLIKQQPYNALIEKNEKFFEYASEQNPEMAISLIKAVTHIWAGKTPDEFESEVMDFISTAKHEKFLVNYTDLVYKPMLELFDFLNYHDYRIFVCSGGDREFMRVFAESTWQIYKEDVIGTHSEYEYKDGKLKRSYKVFGGLQ